MISHKKSNKRYNGALHEIAIFPLLIFTDLYFVYTKAEFICLLNGSILA